MATQSSNGRLSMPRIIPGRFIHKLAIQSPSDTVDSSFGTPGLSWTTAATRWASIRQLSGDELQSAQQIQALATHSIECHYLAGVTPKYRGVFQSRVFQFLWVDNVEERGFLMRILAIEQKA